MDTMHSITTRELTGLQLTVAGEAITVQRQEQRHWLYSAIIVTFYNHGKLFRCYVADLSSGGARIVLPIGIPFLSIGRKMECYLLNRYGSSKCRGTIQLMQRVGPVKLRQ